MSELVWTLHTVSGAVARVPEHLLAHPVLGELLVEVPPHTKSYDPELWKPTTAEKYKAAHARDDKTAQAIDGDDAPEKRTK